MAVLTLLSRPYCHLCDEMRDAVHTVAQRHGTAVIEVDVDAFPDLEARFGDAVPVLMLGAPADEVELCRHRFDRARVEAALGSAK
jgi:hypothetical protein